jgi:hypothetical protein
MGFENEIAVMVSFALGAICTVALLFFVKKVLPEKAAATYSEPEEPEEDETKRKPIVDQISEMSSYGGR